jgi:hypothetical protein
MDKSAFREVMCPTCYAEVGAMCGKTKTRSGRWERAAYHTARKREYEKKINAEIMAETLGPVSDVYLDVAASELHNQGNG